MRRRTLLGSLAAAGISGSLGETRRRNPIHEACDCSPQIKRATDTPPGSTAFQNVTSKLRITGVKVFGVTLDESIAQCGPPLCVRENRNQPGRGGMGRSDARRQGLRRHGVRE